MNEDEIRQKLKDNNINTIDELVALAKKEFVEGITTLVSLAKCDRELRKNLLTDPVRELRKRGIPFLPGTTIGFHEDVPTHIQIALEPFEGPEE